MGNNFVVKNGSANGTSSASFKTISELLEVYDLSPLVALEWVWSDPSLRKILIKRAWREMVKSEYGKIGAAARNEKMTDEQREESAAHASRARWKKYWEKYRDKHESLRHSSVGQVQEQVEN